MIQMKHGPLIRYGFRWTGPDWLRPYIEQFLQPELPFWGYKDMDYDQRYSTIRSRYSDEDISLDTRFSRNIKLRCPISSAPMMTVGSVEIAQVLQLRYGGVAVIPRSMPIAEQKRRLRQVKRNAHFFKISDPAMLTLDHTKTDAKKLFAQEAIGSIILVDNFTNRVVKNIVTPRDLFGSHSDDTPLGVLVSGKRVITAPEDVSREEARRIMRDVARVKQLPLVGLHGVLAGLVTAQDLDVQDPSSRKYAPYAAWDRRGQNLLGVAALGLHDFEERAAALYPEHPDGFLIAIAQGGMEWHFEAIRYLKRTYPDVDVISASIHTPELTEMVARAGGDSACVGVGPGEMCTTNRNVGVGGSQFSAVLRCAEAAHKFVLPVIADGGIRYGRDAVLALAAGASCVMMGTLFAGTDEAPGDLKRKDGRLYKKHFGMASDEARMILQNLQEAGLAPQGDRHASEGEEGFVPHQGPVSDVIEQFLGWIRSGMSYLGAHTIAEMPKRVVFNPRTK